MSNCSHVSFPCTACGFGFDPVAYARLRQAQLESSDVTILRMALLGAQRERDEYQRLLHEANELKIHMTTAATAAAASTVSAIDALQEANEIVEQVKAWFRCTHLCDCDSCAALLHAAAKQIKREGTRS